MRAKRRSAIGRASHAGVALVACGAALWGMDGVLRQPLVSDGRWSSWTIVFYEHVILTLIVAGYLVRRRRDLGRLTLHGWASVVGIAWGGSALATLAFTEALSRSFFNPTVVILLQMSQPLFAVTAAGAVLGERPRPRFLAFFVPALAGIYLLSFGTTSPTRPVAGAALLALVAAGLWGSATALGRRALEEVDYPLVTALRFTVALPLLLVIAAVNGAVLPPGAREGADWLRLPLIAIGPGLVALLLYYRGLRSTPAGVATLAELAFPATAIVVNWIFLDAPLNGAQMLGFLVLWSMIALLHHLPVRLPAEPRRPARAFATGR